MNGFFCTIDRLQPCRVILVPVSEKADVVAVNKRSAGCAREGLRREDARRGSRFAGRFVQLCVGHAPVLSLMFRHDDIARLIDHGMAVSIVHLFAKLGVDIATHRRNQGRQSFLPIAP